MSYTVIVQVMTIKQLLLSCREVGFHDYCDYIVTGETEEDIVRSAAEHDMKVHGKTDNDTAGIRERVKGFIY
jgi:predicted small metal-binding protein